jgi:hypothetical protein
MRAVALAVLLTNAAFVGDAPRVASGRQPRTTRVVEPAPAPAGWKATRDRDTGTLASLWGGSVAAPGSMTNAVLAEHAARQFLAAHIAGDFTLAASRFAGDKRVVVFDQRWNGLRVAGATISIVFTHDRLVAAFSSAIDPATIPTALAALRSAARPNPTRAERWLRDAKIAASATRWGGERVVLPIVFGTGDVTFSIADVLDASNGVERWTVYVAPDGAPLLRVRRTMHGVSTLRLDVPVRHPASARTLMAAGRANLIVNNAAAQTDAAGGFAWNGNAPSSVVPSATGALVEVIDVGGAPATATLSGVNAGFTDWSLASTATADAQLTAYAYAMVAKTRAREIHPSLAWLDQTLQVFVNEAGSCNALSTGDDIHFFAGDATCENTARIVDIVLHEFGHSLHVQSHLAGEVDSALGEGAADFFAANLVGDSGIGRGLSFDDVSVRELDPIGSERRFPEDFEGSVHNAGLIIGGALWDLRTALIAELGAAAGIAATERVYLGVLQLAPDIATSYQAALLGDDDDGDLTNGTPHECAIEAAFAAHGLVPGFEETALSTPVVEGRTISITVTTPVGRACPPKLVTGIDLVVGDETIAMTAEGARYRGELPAPPGPAVVSYHVIARFDDGSELALPRNPADPQYQAFVGTATPIWCDRLDALPVWQQTGSVIWEWARPFGRAGDPPVTFTGEAFLGTNIMGSGRYLPGMATAITTPTIDTSGFTDVHLQFRRWLTVEERAADRASIEIGDQPIWENATVEHVDREWRFVDLPIPSGEVAITWSLAANDTGELGGWNLDDICVVAFDEACATPDCLEPVDEAGCCASGDGRSSLALGALVLFGLRRRRHCMRLPPGRRSG